MTYNPTYSRARNVVERCVGWLKQYRSIATRFEKLAVNYLTLVKLAMLQRYSRVLTATDVPPIITKQCLAPTVSGLCC